VRDVPEYPAPEVDPRLLEKAAALGRIGAAEEVEVDFALPKPPESVMGETAARAGGRRRQAGG